MDITLNLVRMLYWGIIALSLTAIVYIILYENRKRLSQSAGLKKENEDEIYDKKTEPSDLNYSAHDEWRMRLAAELGISVEEYLDLHYSCSDPYWEPPGCIGNKLYSYMDVIDWNDIGEIIAKSGKAIVEHLEKCPGCQEHRTSRINRYREVESNPDEHSHGNKDELLKCCTVNGSFHIGLLWHHAKHASFVDEVE